MQLSLSYDGCTAVHNLTSDEVYILRENEKVTRYYLANGFNKEAHCILLSPSIRIDCFSSGLAGNVDPFLTFDRYEGPLSFMSTPEIDTRYITLDWPRLAYLSIPDSGLPVENHGLYTCRTDSATIQHYIYNSKWRHIKVQVEADNNFIVKSSRPWHNIISFAT